MSEFFLFKFCHIGVNFHFLHLQLTIELWTLDIPIAIEDAECTSANNEHNVCHVPGLHFLLIYSFF